MNKDDLHIQLGYLHEWVRAVDQKISILFGVLSAVLTLLISLAQLISKNHTEISNLSFIYYLTGIGFLGYAFLKSFFSIYPKLNKNFDKPSLIYFNDISKLSINNFRKKVKNTSSSEYVTELIDQVFNLSKITSQKYTQLKDSLILFLISILLLIGSYVLFMYKINYGT